MWLHAGVLEEGVWRQEQEGVPQGSSIGPLLANIYLHYAFDLDRHYPREEPSAVTPLAGICGGGG